MFSFSGVLVMRSNLTTISEATLGNKLASARILTCGMVTWLVLVVSCLMIPLSVKADIGAADHNSIRAGLAAGGLSGAGVSPGTTGSAPTVSGANQECLALLANQDTWGFIALGCVDINLLAGGKRVKLDADSSVIFDESLPTVGHFAVGDLAGEPSAEVPVSPERVPGFHVVRYFEDADSAPLVLRNSRRDRSHSRLLPTTMKVVDEDSGDSCSDGEGSGPMAGPPDDELVGGGGHSGFGLQQPEVDPWAELERANQRSRELEERLEQVEHRLQVGIDVIRRQRETIDSLNDKIQEAGLGIGESTTFGPFDLKYVPPSVTDDGPFFEKRVRVKGRTITGGLDLPFEDGLPSDLGGYVDIQGFKISSSVGKLFNAMFDLFADNMPDQGVPSEVPELLQGLFSCAGNQPPRNPFETVTVPKHPAPGFTLPFDTDN
jgi:hypothetical protein